MDRSIFSHLFVKIVSLAFYFLSFNKFIGFRVESDLNKNLNKKFVLPLSDFNGMLEGEALPGEA